MPVGIRDLTSRWRDLIPANAINKAAENGTRLGWSTKLVHISGFVDITSPAIQDIIFTCEVITIQRNIFSEPVFDAIQYWRGLGKTVIADLDDAYQLLGITNPAFHFWKENSGKIDPPPLKQLEHGLSLCDALTAPNRLLLQDWSHVVKGYYLQNFARNEDWENLKSRAEMKAQLGLQDKIVIGWGGSISHYDTWWGSGIREAATHICRHYPNVVWMICGNDSRIYEQLPIHKDNKFYQPGVDAEQWPQIVKTFDIGVAPLFGIYDQRRSWIKTLEYGLSGTPWVATEGEPYRDHASLGKLLINSPERWEYAIEETIVNLAKEQALAEQRVELYKSWCIDSQLDTYERIFNEIIQQQKINVGSLPGIHYVGAKK